MANYDGGVFLDDSYMLSRPKEGATTVEFEMKEEAS
jgi:hypothetical protein